ncbi:hypothetical protein GIB67_008667 [Kingdonia uniflora]|uniref:Uncharacterized protein n=1 Tax=Kingdonia uniflora TaxID=39325 RepID=A0A7J7M505_9MAGN|nr:hypothetical protein GIB67_008667 [Kingdonia uniflora]
MLTERRRCCLDRDESIHLRISAGLWFMDKRKTALFEALEKVYIGRICIPMKAANLMLPCPLRHTKVEDVKEHRQRLLWNDGRFLAAAGAEVKKCKTGHEPLISSNGVHQLHIHILSVSLSHVI